MSDLRRAIDFYSGSLGFEPAGCAPQVPTASARLRLGAQHIDLVASDGAVRPAEAANAPDPRFQHAAIVTDDMEASWRRLERYGAVGISRGGPQRLPAHTGGVIAFKFRDLDGHPLELIQFPPGIGDPCWQIARAGGPTLGIDHFALVVADVDASIAFLAAQMGMRVTGRDLNAGLEQDRLDGLDGVEVDVVTLAPRQGPRTPHLELLHYRRPTLAAPIDRCRAAVDRDRDRDEIVCLGERRQHAGPAAIHLRDPDGHRFIVDL